MTLDVAALAERLHVDGLRADRSVTRGQGGERPDRLGLVRLVVRACDVGLQASPSANAAGLAEPRAPARWQATRCARPKGVYDRWPRIAQSCPTSSTQAAARCRTEFDTRRLADRLDEGSSCDTISADDRAFIERMDMFFLATADEHGRPNCSYKGGEPGFVRVARRAHDRLPQLRRQRHVPVDGQRAARTRTSACCSSTSRASGGMRLNGEATIDARRPADGRVSGGAVHRARARARGLSELPALHPQDAARRALALRAAAACETPVPAWKRSDWARDVLPRGDPARDRPTIPARAGGRLRSP